MLLQKYFHNFCEHMLLFLLNIYLEEKLTGKRVTECLLVKDHKLIVIR